MFGKWFEIKYTDCEIKVFIFCTPKTTDKELRRLAIERVKEILG